MGYIFLSYSRRDSQFVDALRSRLESNGIQVWVDRTDIQGGSKWRSEIVKAIEGADSMIVILSPYSIQSDNVRKELDIAESQQAKIIPVEIGRIAIPPDFKYQLAGLQRIDMGRNFDAGLSQLLAALRMYFRSSQSVQYQPSRAQSPSSYQSIVYKYAQLIKDKHIYFLSAIPEKTLAKVYQHYSRNALALNEMPICLVDDVSHGSGKYGIFVTNQTLYWRDSVLNSGKSIALKSISSSEPIRVLSIGYAGIRINNEINIYTKKSCKLVADLIQELARV